jgi:hypothetical protein
VLNSVAEGAVGIDWRGSELRNSAAGVGERYSVPIDHDRLPTRQEAYQQARADFEVTRGRGRGAPLDASGMLLDDIALAEAEEAEEAGAEAAEAEPGYGPAGDSPGEARLEAHVDTLDLPTPGPASDYDLPPARPDGTPIPCFDGPPAREQTRQGQLGDCGVIATLGAIAGHRPEAIKDCVRPIDDGGYEVLLHETRYVPDQGRTEPTGRMITLTVTKDLPVLEDEPGTPAFAGLTRESMLAAVFRHRLDEDKPILVAAPGRCAKASRNCRMDSLRRTPTRSWASAMTIRSRYATRGIAGTRS